MNEKILLIIISSLIGASVSFLFSYFLYYRKVMHDALRIKKSIISGLEGIHFIREYWLQKKFSALVACEFYDILLDKDNIDRELIKTQFLMRQTLLTESTTKLYETHRYFIEKISEVSLHFNMTDELSELIEKNINMNDIKVKPNFNKNSNYQNLKLTKDKYELELTKEIDVKFTSISLDLIKFLKTSLK